MRKYAKNLGSPLFVAFFLRQSRFFFFLCYRDLCLLLDSNSTGIHQHANRCPVDSHKHQENVEGDVSSKSPEKKCYAEEDSVSDVECKQTPEDYENVSRVVATATWFVTRFLLQQNTRKWAEQRLTLQLRLYMLWGEDLYPSAFTDDDAPSLVLSPLEFGTFVRAEIVICAPSLTKIDVR